MGKALAEACLSKNVTQARALGENPRRRMGGGVAQSRRNSRNGRVFDRAHARSLPLLAVSSRAPTTSWRLSDPPPNCTPPCRNLQVVFDRGGNLYHGRIKAVADAAREAGLTF